MNLISRPICGGGEEWGEANAKLGEKKRELSRQLELSWGFGELIMVLAKSANAKLVFRILYLKSRNYYSVAQNATSPFEDRRLLRGRAQCWA